MQNKWVSFLNFLPHSICRQLLFKVSWRDCLLRRYFDNRLNFDMACWLRILILAGGASEAMKEKEVSFLRYNPSQILMIGCRRSNWGKLAESLEFIRRMFWTEIYVHFPITHCSFNSFHTSLQTQLWRFVPDLSWSCSSNPSPAHTTGDVGVC